MSETNPGRCTGLGLRRPLMLVGALFVVLGVLPFATLRPAHSGEPLDEVLASVNQSLITRRDIRLYALDLRLREGAFWNLPVQEMEEDLLPVALEEAVLYHHFFRASRPVPEEQLTRHVEDQWLRYVRRIGSPERLRELLRDEGVRAAELRAWLKERARRREVVNHGLMLGIDPSLLNRADDRPRDADRFLLGEIYLRPIEQSPAGWAEAAERAARLRLRLQEGMRFEDAARLFSDHEAIGRQGGSLGWLEREHLDPEILREILELPPGGVTPPVRGRTGFHVFRLEDFETPARRDAWEAYQVVRARVLQQALEEIEVSTSLLDAEGIPQLFDRSYWEPEAVSGVSPDTPGTTAPPGY